MAVGNAKSRINFFVDKFSLEFNIHPYRNIASQQFAVVIDTDTSQSLRRNLTHQDNRLFLNLNSS